jgi:hypothetical protein
MRGDLPDAEHAVHAAVTCDGFVTERDAAAVLQQMKMRGILCRSRIAQMSDGWETLEFIQAPDSLDVAHMVPPD